MNSEFDTLGVSHPFDFTFQPIQDQIRILKKAFGLDRLNLQLENRISNGQIVLPQGATGWAAIPNWKKHPNKFDGIYAKAVSKVFHQIGSSFGCKFMANTNCRIDDSHLHQYLQTQVLMSNLSLTQGNPDILIVACQLGVTRLNQDPDFVRKSLEQSEFCLGSFEVGCILLTNFPKCLEDTDQIRKRVDCPGDIVSHLDNKDFSQSTTSFCYGDGVLLFGFRPVMISSEDSSSATGYFIEYPTPLHMARRGVDIQTE